MEGTLNKEEVREINRNLRPHNQKMCNKCWNIFDLTKDNFRLSMEYGKLRYYFLCKTCEHLRDSTKKTQAALDPDKRIRTAENKKKYKQNNKQNALVSNRKSYHKRKIEKILEMYNL